VLAQILLAVSFLTLLVGSFFQFLYRYIASYRLTETSIQFVMFRVVPVMRIRYADIAEIREVSWRQILIVQLRELLRLRFPLGLGNRVIGRAVQVQKRRGVFRAIFITPDDVPAFLQQVRQHLLAG
jgi:hypothetical protein